MVVHFSFYRIGATFIKTNRKRIFVFVIVFAFMFTVSAYSLLRGSFYVIAITVLTCCVFEIATVFIWGLLAKNISFVRIV